MSDSQNSSRTVTRTREKIEVEEVEETLYVCENCDQAYENSEMVTVGLDVDEDGGVEEERQVCLNCTDGLFDYDKNQSVTDYVSHRTRHWSVKEFSVAALTGGLLAALLAGLLSVYSWAVGYGSRGVAEMLAVSSEQEAATMMQHIMGDMVAILPLILMMGAIIHFVASQHPEVGGRR